jgi:non-ribosomal peptide synthetase-like protein
MTPQPALTPQAADATGLVLHQIFAMQAEAQSNAVAVEFGTQTITYGELEARANRLAHYLRGHGVSRGSAVALLAPRSIDTYAALLGILKSGAAYVPIDPDYPTERVAYILADSGATALVTTPALSHLHRGFSGTVIDLDASAADIAEESSLAPDDVEVQPEDLCYIIYTSGSTGKPKGVMVEHRNACHLVQAEGRIFGVRPGDRIYQGASLAFDLSVEEIWLAFHSGATLIAATPEMAHSGPDLARRLEACGVTVLSCVPTLLSMLAEDIPSVRLLILGGEVCPNQLVARWARPGRRIVNTYGPTEATVIATYADLAPHRPVTIGRAVPGYEIHILDDELQPVPEGQRGEICISGAGVARGYVGRPAETLSRFVLPPGSGARVYRTGDLGRRDSAGDIHFMGRVDGQVKLRAFRVELSEIEAVMLECADVLAAACAIRDSAAGIPQLVGYAVPHSGGKIDEARLVAHLRRQLPAWMVPAVIEEVKDLPRLPSGKVDRARLPEPSARQKAARPVRVHTRTERRIIAVWSALFHPLQVSVDDDFFLDLGGHSLLVARMVSELRKEPAFASLAVTDVYKHPTIAQLAAAIDAAPAQSTSIRPESAAGAGARHLVAGLTQTLSLYFVFAFRGLSSIAPFLAYFATRSVIWAATIGASAFPAQVLIAVVAKWLLLGRIRAGRYPLWGWYYLRWWFVRILCESAPLTRLSGTPLLPFVYRLFGARIGRNVHIATDRVAAFDLIAIGDGSSIDESASLLGHEIESGELVIGPIRVGRGCFVGARSVLCPSSSMDDGARLEDLSLLPADAQIPAGETWAGSPPRRIDSHGKECSPRPVFNRFLTSAFYCAATLLLPLIELLAFAPGIALLTRYPLAAPLAGASFILCLTTEVVLLKWLLIGRARPGSYPVHGWFYLRHWVVEQLLALSVDIAGPLHATVYLKPWFRALGARLGRFAEVSTATITTPDLLDIQEDSTIADEVSLSAARVEGGWLTLAPIRLGRRAFVGNNAVVPAGVTLGDHSLIGVLTVAPQAAEQAGSCWLGSPPILLPRRELSAGFNETATFRPSAKLQWSRAAFELLRVTLPGAGFIAVTLAVVDIALALRQRAGVAFMLAASPAIFAACAFLALLAVAAIKWIVIGRYRPFERPFWSVFVWRLEFVNALFEFFASELALDALQGTPLLPWYLRLLGARIGRGTCIWTTGILEFDLTEIGDRTILNHDCILQTHLFEDRILKASRLRVGADCEIGTQTVVLYDTEMHDGAKLGPLSLLMKGESLREGGVWIGSPLAKTVKR